MSITNFLATEFNGEQVVRYFNVPPHDHAVRAAMHYMFRMHKDELQEKGTLAERCKIAADLTVEAIEYRYTLFKEMLDDFFQGKQIDRDALVIAIICNEYTPHINEPCPNPNGKLRSQSDGIDPELGEIANILWEESVNLKARGSLPYEVSAESLFLAHVIAFEAFAKYEVDEDSEWYDESTIENILNEDIPTIRSFLRTDTEIGEQLENFLNHMVSTYSPSAPPPPQSHKTHLHIVPKDPSL